MNPTELAIVVITSIVSWRIVEAIRKKIERDKNFAAFKTTFTVCASVALIGATVAGLYLGYHRIRQVTEPPKAEPLPETPDPQVASVPTPTPRSPSVSHPTFRPRRRSGQRLSQSSAPVTSQLTNAPTTAQVSQAPNAVPPAQSQSPQAPATEARPLFAPIPRCPTPPAPATIIIPPGEKGPEQDELV